MLRDGTILDATLNGARDLEPAGRLEAQAWMTRPETRAVMAALAAGGRPARFVGGCVRDALLERGVADVDIATEEPPENVVTLLEAGGLRALPTGIEHGTITAISGGIPHEVTTLRHDVETHGRHATVAFTDDWAADAARRDFTLNALYADADGTLYDPVGGMADLTAGRIRFVGDARTRIEEDVLRLLRYFRFYAWYGRTAPDDEALTACRVMAPRIATLSVERVWSELRRLMLAPDPAHVLELMADHDVLAYVLPEAVLRDRLAALTRLEARRHVTPDPIRRLAAAMESDNAVARALAIRLRMATVDASRLETLAAPSVRPRGEAGDTVNRVALYRLGEAVYGDLALIGAAGDVSGAAGSGEAGSGAAGSGEAKSGEAGWDAVLSLAARAPVPSFPLAGRDIRAAGIEEGPRIGGLLEDIESWWIDGGFAADRAQCLERLDALLA